MKTKNFNKVERVNKVNNTNESWFVLRFEIMNGNTRRPLYRGTDGGSFKMYSRSLDRLRKEALKTLKSEKEDENNKGVFQKIYLPICEVHGKVDVMFPSDNTEMIFGIEEIYNYEKLVDTSIHEVITFKSL